MIPLALRLQIADFRLLIEIRKHQSAMPTMKFQIADVDSIKTLSHQPAISNAI